MSTEIKFLSKINSFQSQNFRQKDFPPRIEHTNFLSTEFLSFKTKWILSRIEFFLSKEILLELEQNNFFSTEINSSQDFFSQIDIFPVTRQRIIVNWFLSTKIISSKEKNYSFENNQSPEYKNLDCMLIHQFFGNRKKVILVQM